MHWYVSYIHMHKIMFTLTITISTVHGFTNVSYTVSEGETLNITFTNDIKGSSNLPPFLLGTISVLPDTARMYAYFIVTYLKIYLSCVVQ